MSAGRRQFPTHLWGYIAAFVGLAAFAIVLIATVFAALEQRQRQDQFLQLSTLLQLKAQRIETWLTRLRVDIEEMGANPALREDLQRFAAHPDPAAGIRLQEQFRASRLMEDAIGIELADGRGQPLLTIGRRVHGHEPAAPPPSAAVPSRNHAVFVDFHRDTPNGPPHLAYELPLPGSADGSSPAVHLRVLVDPERTLYPLVRTWPLTTISGEVLLVRPDGDQLLALSELRHRAGSVLDFRLPASAAGMPAAQAGDRVYSGQDYRHVNVLAAARAVAGTSWTLIAKVDAAEAFGSLHSLRTLSIGIALVTLCLGGVLLWLVWHRQAQREQHALARQLMDLAATVPGALASLRLKAGGRASFPYASPATEELLGLAPAELERNADTFFALIHPADAAAVRAGLADSASQLSLWHAEFRILHPHKGETWIEVRSTPRRQPDGSVLWHGFFQDIGPRRSAQLALQRANERWRQLAEAMPQLVWIANGGGECQYVNRHWVDYTGLDPERQAGREWLEAIHPEDRLRLTAAFSHAIADKGIFDGEFRLRRADGQYHWFKTHAVPVGDGIEAPMAWYGFNTDIQEIKEYESALQRSLLRQQALQQLDRAVLEARTPQEVAARGLAHLDALLPCWGAVALAIDLDAGEGRVLAVSGGTASSYAAGQRVPFADYGAQDLALLEKGQVRVVGDLGATERIPPIMEPLHRQGLRSYVRIPLMFERRLVGALSLGSDRPGYFGKAEVETARPLADVVAIALQQAQLRQNQLLQTATLEMRVQERTAELEHLKNQAEAASRAKSQFLANISQELQTPLNSLLILAEMLADNAHDNLTPEQREFARVIHNAGSDLLGLINDILDLSKIETGRAAVHGGDIPFETVLGYVDGLFRKGAEGKGLQFAVGLGEELPDAIHSDFDHLKPILRNLMSNAIKFTPTGTVGLRIHRATAGWPPGRPALAQADTVIAFEVADTGIGIPEEKLAVIFDAFAQAEGGGNRRYGGTGLGLHIAQANAELLGGDLTVSSTPGQGSTFTLYLPRLYVAPASVGEGEIRSGADSRVA